MVTRIVVVGALILALMIALKDGRLLRTAGLTSSCSVVQTAADGTQLEGCRPGRLEGRPDLSGQGCRSIGVNGTLEYWRCPAPVVSAANGR